MTGRFMDPSNPTKPSRGKKFRFREWVGYAFRTEGEEERKQQVIFGKKPKIEVYVSEDTVVTAIFDIEE
jgi:hypothetical protein